MPQTLAITDYIDSLAAVDAVFGLSQSPDPSFFTEWMENLPDLSVFEQQRLDVIKQRFLYHRQQGHLLEGAVNFILMSPLLELAGFCDPPFRLRSEVSVRFEMEDERDRVYQGRIDALVVEDYLWIVLVESKRTSFNVTLALPQALAYLSANSQSNRPTFGLVSNGEYSIFVKLFQSQYGFSDDFSLNRRQNDLYDVLRILARLKSL
ncbi:hypothetical protein LEP3755_38110 [Leptolyngbya sp. NIES-3755]|nr:hypothetical protein LEP3755_38110 [Leptolyngbya sp. NIES-3755]